MKTWVYKVWIFIREASFGYEENVIEKKLNGFGRDGWELVSVTPQVKGDDSRVKTQEYVFVFKKSDD